MLHDQTVHLFTSIHHNEKWHNFRLIQALLSKKFYDLLIGP